ncbi:MAG: RIP metalloprotease RseP [Spirochaetaceae bacterium]|nr:RIP metalloprotease RseP [Spirochaetaceae bacterium]
MTIIYGLIGLGFIVFIHELGHFITAKICGVTVESFSIGMGPILLHKTIKGTDYRLSLIPLGGYCGMKGQKDFQVALDEKLESITGDKDSFYGIHPLKRVIIAFSGPFFNFIFAAIAFMIISMIGYSYYTSENKIILANEVYPEMESIAEKAGLQTGDKILSVNDKETPYFTDIYEAISISANKKTDLQVQRDSEIFNIEVTPSLNKETGAGVLGIVSWTNPLIDSVEKNSIAEKVGLKEQDLILQINDDIIKNTADYNNAIQKYDNFSMKVLRDNNEIIIENIELNPQKEDKTTLGITFYTEKVKSKTYSFFPAIINGFVEAGKTTALTFKSLGLLFQGVDLTKAVSGPLRITVMLGDTAKAGFSAGFSTGIVTVFNFLAIISISLFIMNLLPIPILDGGLILFALIEAITKKQISPKIQYYVQFIGVGLILVLFVFAMFGDISYIINLFTSK